jgi:hypothetical protein
MSLELALCLAIALVGGVAQWRACHRTPIARVNHDLARARARRRRA